MTQERQMAEQATGIRENPHGLGALYREGGAKVTLDEAKTLLREGGAIEIPNAGSGSYRSVFASLGFTEVKVIDWTSSAGDWCFGVFDGESWFVAFQSNRYPYCGFRYSVNMGNPVDSFEELTDGQ